MDISALPYAASGDGKTDNYQILQRAFSDMQKAGGGTIYFPAGSFRIEIPSGSHALQVPSNSQLYGEPGQRSKLQFNISNPELHTALSFKDQTQLVIQDLFITGTQAKIPYRNPAYWALISLRDSHSIQLINTTITNAQRLGMEILACTDVSIRSSEFTRNGWVEEIPNNQPQPVNGGLWVQPLSAGTRNHNLTIENSSFTHNGGFGAWVGYVDGLTIKGSTFTNNGFYPFHGNQDGLGLFGILGGTIENNQVFDNLADGIVVATQKDDPADTSRTSQLTISNNTSARNGANGILLYSTQGSRATIDQVSMINNTSYDNGFGNRSGFPNSFDGIRLSPWGANGAIHDISISGNTCYDTRSGSNRTQQVGIGELPRERHPVGRLGDNIKVYGNRCYNNFHADIWFWDKIES